jgi:hypothetical protein
MNIDISKASPLITTVLKSKLVPYLESPPGVGKSALAQQIADENGLKLVDVRLSQCDPTDLSGLPFATEDGKGHKRATYLPIDIWPLEGDDLPDGKRGWLLLLDELSSAPPAVQAASYKLLLDRAVGMYHLHPAAFVMAAGNRLEDKAIVHRMGTAQQSRLIHFELDTSLEGWMEWANKNNINFQVKSFLNFRPDALHRFNPDHNEKTFPCPRTWEFVSKLLNNLKTTNSHSSDIVPLLAGTIGEGTAREFYSFTQIYNQVPSIDEILRNPTGIALSDEPSIHYALSGLVGHHININNIKQLMPFILKLNIEFQVIVLKAGIAKDFNIKETKEVKAWIDANAKELAGN